MSQDVVNLLDETVELTGIAEAWRDKAEEYRRRAVYAEGQWLALDEEVMRLRREVARLRKLLLAEEPRFVDKAADKWSDLLIRRRAVTAGSAAYDRLTRAMDRFDRIEQCFPAFGPTLEVSRG